MKKRRCQRSSIALVYLVIVLVYWLRAANVRHVQPNTESPIPPSRLELGPRTTLDVLKSDRISKNEAYISEREHFQQQLIQRQFHREPSTYIAYIDDDPSAGFGSRMLRIVSAFLVALRERRPLTFPVHGHWTYSSCESRTNDCYFLPISDFQVQVKYPAEIQRKEGTLLSNSSLWTRGSLDAFYHELQGTSVDWTEHLGLELPETVGGCWLAGQLLYYLLQPNAAVQQVLLQEKGRMGWGHHPIAAFHVRHGDRAQRGHQGSNLQLADFIAKLKEVDPTVKNILLMTEDGGVVQDTANYPQYKFFITEIQPRKNDDINRLLAEGKLDPEKEMHNALVNLYLAIDCEYFLGHLSSTWGRLVMLLSYGKYGCFQTHHLMGSKWKSRWGFSSCTDKDFVQEVHSRMCTTV